MRVTVYHIIQTKLAHFAVVRTKLRTAIELAIINLLLSICTLTVDEISIVCTTA